MKKLHNSNFELIQDVIKDLDFNYNPSNQEQLEQINKYWSDVVGKKISKLSRVTGLSSENILTVVCSDSFVSNELYFEKQNLLKFMNKNIENMGINIKDIKFDYKKWKEET